MNIGAALVDISVISGLAARIKVNVSSNHKATDPVKDAEKIIQICERLADTVSDLLPAKDRSAHLGATEKV